MNNQILIAFALYFFAIISIGIFVSKKQKKTIDFILGDRKLNYWVAAISANASDMSIWVFMGLPASIYLGGIIKSWSAFGLILFMFLSWHFIAPKLRISTENYNSLTLFSYFEARLEDKSGGIKLISAIWSLIFLSIYISAGLIGIGHLFEIVFNINYEIGCILGVSIVIMYSYFGGFEAVTLMDFFQGIFLLIILIFIPLFTLSKIANFNNIILLSKNYLFSSTLSNAHKEEYKAIFIMITSWGLGYFGQPHILNKFMAIKNPKKIKKAKIISTIWQIITLSASTSIGLIAIHYLKKTQINPEFIFIEIVKDLCNPFFSGMILCSILAATLSTIDSQILVLSSVISEDIYKNIINKKSSNEELIKISRYSILIISMIALIIAILNKKSIFNLVEYCWSGLGCAFGPLVIMCLYSKTINKYGALCGMLSGGIVGVTWNFFNNKVPSTIPGFLTGLITIFIISILSKKKLN